MLNVFERVFFHLTLAVLVTHSNIILLLSTFDFLNYNCWCVSFPKQWRKSHKNDELPNERTNWSINETFDFEYGHKNAHTHSEKETPNNYLLFTSSIESEIVSIRKIMAGNFFDLYNSWTLGENSITFRVLLLLLSLLLLFMWSFWRREQSSKDRWINFGVLYKKYIVDNNKSNKLYRKTFSDFHINEKRKIIPMDSKLIRRLVSTCPESTIPENSILT